MKLQQLVNQLASNPTNIEVMFKLAEEYVKLKQYSAAYTYYLHCLESVKETEYGIRYHCMMMIAWIYYISKNRLKSVYHFCKLAKAECPDRPEAYYLYSLARSEELKAVGVTEQWDWVDVYESSGIGLLYAKKFDPRKSRYYDGIDCLKVLYLESLFKLNKLQEAKDFIESENYNNVFIPRVFDTLTWAFNELGYHNPLTKLPMIQLAPPVKYILDKFHITNNYAKSFEDIFAVIYNHLGLTFSCVHYTDSDPITENNTRLLRDLGWNVDYYVHSDDLLNKYKSFSLNVYKDDFMKVYSKIGHLDISTSDPYGNKYILENILNHGINPNTVVFRHDVYKGNHSIKSEVENLMNSHGYQRIVNNVRFNMTDPYEDWYCRKDLIDFQIEYQTLTSICSKSDILCNDIFH